jgi:hypothetical protein
MHDVPIAHPCDAASCEGSRSNTIAPSSSMKYDRHSRDPLVPLAVLLSACNPSEPVERGESIEIVDAPSRVALAPYLMIPTQPVEHEPCESAPETKTKVKKPKKRKPDREKIKLEMIQGDFIG